MKQFIYYFLVLHSLLITLRVMLRRSSEKLKVDFVIECHLSTNDLTHARAQLKMCSFVILGHAKVCLLSLFLQNLDVRYLLVNFLLKHSCYFLYFVLVIINQLLFFLLMLFSYRLQFHLMIFTDLYQFGPSIFLQRFVGFKIVAHWGLWSFL